MSLRCCYLVVSTDSFPADFNRPLSHTLSCFTQTVAATGGAGGSTASSNAASILGFGDGLGSGLACSCPGFAVETMGVPPTAEAAASSSTTLHVRATQGKIALMQDVVPDDVAGVTLPPWVTLRSHVRQLRLDGDARSGGVVNPAGFFSFSVDDVEEDLVQLVFELTARLRTAKVLAEVRESAVIVATLVVVVVVVVVVDDDDDDDDVVVVVPPPCMSLRESRAFGRTRWMLRRAKLPVAQLQRRPTASPSTQTTRRQSASLWTCVCGNDWLHRPPAFATDLCATAAS
jgi:hypothetical protein